MKPRMLVACLMALSACSADEPPSGAPPGSAVDPNAKRATLAGEITWTVHFDAAAQAAGATDCTYTRRYQAHEDESAPWLCPACERVFFAGVEVVAGLDDCYAQVSPQAPVPNEWVGFGDGVWWRGGGGPMTEQGTVSLDGSDVATQNTVTDLEAPAGGLLAFDVTGALTLGEESGDPLNGFTPPPSYACGWPQTALPPYEGDYRLVVDGELPDGLFKDACDQTVRLHDLSGTYLLIDMAAVDCPPCQSMAGSEEQFVITMASQGIDVRVITLLAPSLADPLGVTTPKMLMDWSDRFGLVSPVLADRGWGLSMFMPAIGDDTGYPSWALVAPDRSVFAFGTGFGGYAEHQAAIAAHQQSH